MSHFPTHISLPSIRYAHTATHTVRRLLKAPLITDCMCGMLVMRVPLQYLVTIYCYVGMGILMYSGCVIKITLSICPVIRGNNSFKNQITVWSE